MRIARLLPVLALGATVLVSSCDSEDHNHIDIQFLEPGNEETVADASDVHVHIRFEAEEENHNVEVRVHPDGDASDLIVDIDRHEHDQVVDVEIDLDLSAYPAGTEFHVEAVACEDHDCEETVESDIHFSIP